MFHQCKYSSLTKVMLVAFLSLFVNAACQTSLLHQFERVKPGMEKDQVLSIMGSPAQTQRFHGKDRWFYNFYDHEIHFQKEIQFFNGAAIYIGEVWQPEESKSAIVQDEINEKQNAKIDSQMKKEIETNRKNFENYEVQTKAADKVRYVPEFKPIQ